MPNWVTNKLTFEGEGKEDLIKSLLTKDSESDEEYFDFNKIIKMPEELFVEKSSRSREGLLLYIAAISVVGAISYLFIAFKQGILYDVFGKEYLNKIISKLTFNKIKLS